MFSMIKFCFWPGGKLFSCVNVNGWLLRLFDALTLYVFVTDAGIIALLFSLLAFLFLSVQLLVCYC